MELTISYAVKIPGDKGGNWRLDKFVEYQHLAPAVDPITYVEYAKRKGLGFNSCVTLAWLHSLTYCEITAAFLFEALQDGELQDPTEFWRQHKDSLIFGSARKYVKNMDWFVPLMLQYAEATKLYNPYQWLWSVADINATPVQRFKNIEKYLSKWKFMGRFSVDLFMEAIVAMHKAKLIPMEIESPLEYDWKKTSNLTSGLLNIFYWDEAADIFDSSGNINPNADLDNMLSKVLRAVEDTYPNQQVDTISVVNKICSFRNLFKNARYGGYHHDRQLGNLRHYQSVYPNNSLWAEFFDIRKSVFPKHMLGENYFWNGIRKERKKLWTEKGETGVESK